MGNTSHIATRMKIIPSALNNQTNTTLKCQQKRILVISERTCQPSWAEPIASSTIVQGQNT